MNVYDRNRRPLPPPIVDFQPGFNASAEVWNGRVAMVAIIMIMIMEAITGQGAFSWRQW
jgi:protoporphyrin/coproporphyrin ferrochelatase